MSSLRAVFPADLPWVPPTNVSPEMEASAAGVLRKSLIAAGASLSIHYVRMPPAHTIQPHSHQLDEVVIVLEGEMILDGTTTLRVHDAAYIPANSPYSVTAGQTDAVFAVIRRTGVT